MRPPNVVLVLVGLVGSGGLLQAQDASQTLPPSVRLESWLGPMRVLPGVYTEMARFEAGGQQPDSPFVRYLADRTRARVLASAGDRLRQIEQEGCRPSVEVGFPDPEEWELPGLEDAERRFLEGMVRTEAVACFDSEANPREALEVYTSPTFRMEAESRIERMWTEGGSACVRTRGVPLLLSRTEVCNRINRLLDSDLAAEHSQVIRNAETGNVQIVFFKESLKTFVKTPDGLVFHYINFTRSVDLGRASRWIAGGKIRESQELQVEALRERIGG